MAGDCSHKGRRFEKLEAYSVLMSVYGKENPAYFRQSLDSLVAQTITPEQIVLVYDGPLTEGLYHVAEQFREKYPELFLIVPLEKQVGLGAALNVGLTECRNELVARMDSDDISVADRCEKQLSVFAKKDIEIVGGNIEEFDGEISRILGRRVCPEKPEEIRRAAGRRNPFNHVSIMFKKSVVKQAGGYQDCPYFEDYHLWARMLKMGARGYNIQSTLCYVRTGEDMYARRGGFSYAKQAFRFRCYLRKERISGFFDFLMTAYGQFLICILPNRFRKWFYEMVLRKKG